MAVLIIGPTSSGKSTLIEKSYQNSNSNNKKKVLFGYELEKNTIDENSIVHYNLLRFLTQDNNNQENLTFENDIAFKIILKNLKKFSQIIVLVTPIEELISRINKRDFNEKHLTSEKYDKTFWLEIIQKTNLFKIYENLFELFEINSLNYEILFSSSKIPDQFVISDRVFVHHNLRGIYISSPSLNEVSKISKSDKFQYQSVTLPYGEKTSVGRFDHITLNRYQSYSPFISMDLKDKSVLDIGCAMGNVVFTAERYGARDLIGIEM